ncbi:MAG TPA: o-succinylbenzoate synthase [Acidimicrobiales bacterium]|nr:o-succinylbenzoate synthase [Acidimicrobiales bacterium]
MRVEEVELRRVALPLATPFRTAAGTTSVRDLLLVRVGTDEGDGWGECAALGEPGYTAEYVEGAHAVIERYFAPALLAGAAGVRVVGHHMARAAVEGAVLDVSLRAEGRSLAEFLGATQQRVAVGAAIGFTGSVPDLLDRMGTAVASGYRRVKLKIEPGWDVEPLAAVRDRFGDGVQVQVDANGSYTRDHVEHLASLDRFGLVLVEQPLPARDLLGHAALARRIATPVCLDESIESADDALVALELGACSVVNIKPGRVGGYREARRVHDVCVERGVPAWCGGMLESGIGRAAALAVAALPGFTLPADLAASDRYYAEDLTEPFVLDAEGNLAVPTGPGIGVTPRLDVLDAVTTSVVRIQP